ncbi:ABC transporter related protein [Paenibacillus curdlanolyticus YK9]|uniref:ABC transporter related protein n=1 Tax=Paenibacillus curdlanolyticus YK9 TaxID=717606 RepID=E0IEQ4_9BACL|nr:ABC transporter ATP-binding protein [Paenibacillus curdlanolyticus]EFM09142.1 ABC transporter related protein [Paenibacillus curdlanolyticus YK9]
MNNISISVRDVSKCFKIYKQPQDRLKQSLMRGKKDYFQEFWALNDISFDIYKGETIGIIGRNGSGKSTLLQIIAGTLKQTSGSVDIRGRVAALLELGSGFNPEFTGRENILMNGTILGLNSAQINELYDEIVSFAEIGEFIDRPVKTYSSGMALRLAFAVQAVVPKEILIVDEALAVGDELFQRKCFLKIEEFKKQGGTILFVSHSAAAIVELCDRAILIDSGEQLIMDTSKRVVNLYQKLVFAPADKIAALKNEIRSLRETGQGVSQATDRIDEAYESTGINDAVASNEPNFKEAMYDPHLIPTEMVAYETRGAQIFDAEIVNIEGEKVNILLADQKYIYRYYVRFDRTCADVRFGMLIKTGSGLELGGAQSALLGRGRPIVDAGEVCKVEFSFTPRLTQGVYFLNAGVLGVDGTSDVYLDRRIDLLAFKILPNESSFMTSIVDFNVMPEVVSIER